MENQEDQAKCIGRLEDELKIAERRIIELKAERDEARDLSSRMQEHVTSSRETIDRWIEAFDMVLGDDGNWTFREDPYDALFEKHEDLVKRWNRLVTRYNATVNDRDPGRPLAASDAQVLMVRKLRRKKLSLRAIADETSLGLQTVRTILGRDGLCDRTSIKRMERIDPMRMEIAGHKARKRTRDALPKRINETLKDGADLIKAAKGLGE